MNRQPEMVLIDVDGTLVDSVPDLAWCVDEMMRRLGLEPRGEARVREWVGNGVERLTRRALVGALEGEPDPALFERAYPIFLELYSANTAVRTRLYPGVIEALDWLQENGYPLGCVTNKASRFTLPLLESLGVAERFRTIICGDTLATSKPDPGPLLHAASQLGANPRRSLMIGDSVSDVKAARAAGFDIVCMSYGYNHGRDIREMNPDAVLDRMDGVAGLLSAGSGAD